MLRLSYQVWLEVSSHNWTQRAPSGYNMLVASVPGITMPCMAEPRKRRNKPIRKGVPLSIHIPRKHREALDALAEENRRTITAELVLALERHFAETGKWPAPPRD